ncbi:centrosomal protein POC5 [Gracilinanus agilis]|uniref:centrosomal protein POC5 n=1 Tax=Gracilinanus agilis TaxID=191870 RepID=UPI001CFF0A58|nr:centrosomal protein POC5 [Gracilinanus agilis]
MSSDEEKPSVAAREPDPDSSVSSDLQTEYEELLRYAVVTPKSDTVASRQSYSKLLGGTDDKILNAEEPHTSGKGPTGREHRIEPGRIKEINSSSISKAEVPSFSPSKRSSHPIMDFFSSQHFNDTSSPGTSSPKEKECGEKVLTESFITDENLRKIESIIELWCSGLKKNVLAELSKWKLNFIDWHRAEMKKEKDKSTTQLEKLQNQVDDLTELQQTYETSAGRKDEVISTLTEASTKQKERADVLKIFFHWRIEHLKAKQEIYEAKLADQHYNRALLKRVWKAWRSILQSHWKNTFERACQTRAEEICFQISRDYETQIVSLNDALETAKSEIQKLQYEKDQYQESLKKAFMRGVCALNLEALSIFQSRHDNGSESTNKKDDYGPGGSGKDGPLHFDPSLLSVATLVPRASVSAQPLSQAPSHIPSQVPSQIPSHLHSQGPSQGPSQVPSHLHSQGPSQVPSQGSPNLHSQGPSQVPSHLHSQGPSQVPSHLHSQGPSQVTSHLHSQGPSHLHSQVTSQGPSHGTAVKEDMFEPKVVTSVQQKAGRTITARIAGRSDLPLKGSRNCGGLAIMGVLPPMSSVVIEKHHPVTQQTIPQALAAKYPRTVHYETSSTSSRHPGHSGKASAQACHSIKVVD